MLKMVWAAALLDLLAGDPRWLPHPVIGIGRLIRRLQAGLENSPLIPRTAGVILAAATVGMTATTAWFLLQVAGALHPLLYAAVWVLFAFSSLAARSLHRESGEVIRCLEQEDLDGARGALSLIVGRETSNLDRPGIIKATLETVAENSSDGVVSPLFYLFLGGPVLALAYKAVNTLDSMVGYRNDRYLEFGWASARLDDLANWLPARLTGGLMVAAAWLLRLRAADAWRVMLRDARKHASPNAGFPEAAAAGALGVQLGGSAVYFGETVGKATLGDADRTLTAEVYREMIRLMYLAGLLALVLGSILTVLVR